MGTVAGTVIRYGDVATLPFGQERMLPGAFGDLSTAELYANRMHERSQPLANTYAGLRIDDNAERLAGEVDLPNTSYGRDTQEEVKTGRLRGLSIEFRTLEDDYIDGDAGNQVCAAVRLGCGRQTSLSAQCGSDAVVGRISVGIRAGGSPAESG